MVHRRNHQSLMQIPRGYDQYVSANGSIPVISSRNSASQKTPQVQDDNSRLRKKILYDDSRSFFLQSLEEPVMLN